MNSVLKEFTDIYEIKKKTDLNINNLCSGELPIYVSQNVK